MPALKKLICLALFALVSSTTACGDSDNDNNHAHHNNHAHNNGGHVSENVHPLGTATSDGGHFTVLATHDPETPKTGNGKMTLTITDAHDNTPVTDLKITLTPWMPAHGHGSNKTPTVTEKDAGSYEISDIVYSMPGDWEARIAIKGEEHHDTIAFGFSVQ